MSKEITTEELLSNLGIDEMKLPANNLSCALAGEESPLYDEDCENDTGSPEKRELLELDNLDTAEDQINKLQTK